MMALLRCWSRGLRLGIPSEPFVESPLSAPTGSQEPSPWVSPRQPPPLIAVIDGDPQHPPEVLEKLVVPLVAGRADVSVGSRYVSGRTSEGLDGQWRVFGSRSVRAITQLLFPEARPLTDHAGRSSVFDSQVVDGYDLRPEVVEMLVGVPVRGHWKESHEVRYRFAGRVHGASTAGIRPGLRLLSHHARLWCSARLPDSVRADLSVSRAR